jgi:hypothetical protein
VTDGGGHGQDGQAECQGYIRIDPGSGKPPITPRCRDAQTNQNVPMNYCILSHLSFSFLIVKEFRQIVSVYTTDGGERQGGDEYIASARITSLGDEHPLPG